MISEELTQANLALASKVEDLQGQVAIHEKLLLLCLDMVKNFGHFIPTAVIEFNKEFTRIRGGEGYTLSNIGEGVEDDQKMSDKEIDTYLKGNPNHPEDLED